MRQPLLKSDWHDEWLERYATTMADLKEREKSLQYNSTFFNDWWCWKGYRHKYDPSEYTGNPPVIKDTYKDIISRCGTGFYMSFVYHKSSIRQHTMLLQHKEDVERTLKNATDDHQKRVKIITFIPVDVDNWYMFDRCPPFIPQYFNQ